MSKVAVWKLGFGQVFASDGRRLDSAVFGDLPSSSALIAEHQRHIDQACRVGQLHLVYWGSCPWAWTFAIDEEVVFQGS